MGWQVYTLRTLSHRFGTDFGGSKVVEPRQIVKTRGCVVTNKEYLQNPLVFFGETSTNKFAVRDFEAEHVEPYCAPMSDLCDVNLITF